MKKIPLFLMSSILLASFPALTAVAWTLPTTPTLSSVYQQVWGGERVPCVGSPYYEFCVSQFPSVATYQAGGYTCTVGGSGTDSYYMADPSAIRNMTCTRLFSEITLTRLTSSPPGWGLAGSTIGLIFPCASYLEWCGRFGPTYFPIIDLQTSGYTCSVWKPSITEGRGSCAKTILLGYDATVDDAYQLTGFKNETTDTSSFSYSLSPFITLHHPPEGPLSVKLDSLLGRFLAIPSFNATHGWEGVVRNGALMIDGKITPHLFYEAELNKVTLSRYGRNFDGKEDVKKFLRDSDFLSRLGFSEKEKQNSLAYLFPKLDAQAPTKFYYLTILSEPSIEETATMAIVPAPKQVTHKYFAVYATNVPVHTDGDLRYPVVADHGAKDFHVAVTGEFLIDPEMFVFWEL
jgi:hypothetical protein